LIANALSQRTRSGSTGEPDAYQMLRNDLGIRAVSFLRPLLR